MGKRKSDYRIPFCTAHDGRRQLHWASEHAVDVEWRENHEFTDSLQFECVERGRSAAYLVWRSTTTGTRYTMFLKDFADILKTRDIFRGFVYTSWTFVKRGENYGVKLAE